MNVLLRSAAVEAEILRFQPITEQSPDGSREKSALAAVEDQGRWAPMRAQAMPSRMRYLARVRMVSGIEVRVVLEIQVESCSVGVRWDEVAIL